MNSGVTLIYVAGVVGDDVEHIAVGLDVVAVDKAADKGANARGGAAGGEQPFEVFRRRHRNRLRISDEDSDHPSTLCDGRCGLAGTSFDCLWIQPSPVGVSGLAHIYGDTTRRALAQITRATPASGVSFSAGLGTVLDEGLLMRCCLLAGRNGNHRIDRTALCE